MSEATKQIYKDHAIDVAFIMETGSMSDQAVLDLFIKEVSLGDDTLTKRKRAILAELGDRFRREVNRGRPNIVSISPKEALLIPWTSPVHPNPAKLPNPSHVGRRVRTADGRVGTIRHEWVDQNDCSGSWGTLRYDFGDDHGTMNNSYSIDAASCTFLD